MRPQRPPPVLAPQAILEPILGGHQRVVKVVIHHLDHCLGPHAPPVSLLPIYPLVVM